MSFLEILALILAAAASVVLAGLVHDRLSGEAYHRAYRKAELEDIAYYESHPGCSYQDAHRNRDRVNRRFRQ